MKFLVSCLVPRHGAWRWTWALVFLVLLHLDQTVSFPLTACPSCMVVSDTYGFTDRERMYATSGWKHCGAERLWHLGDDSPFSVWVWRIPWGLSFHARFLCVAPFISFQRYALVWLASENGSYLACILRCCLLLFLCISGWLLYRGRIFRQGIVAWQGAGTIECIDAGLFSPVSDRHDIGPYTSLITLIVNEICDLTVCTRVRADVLSRLTARYAIALPDSETVSRLGGVRRMEVVQFASGNVRLMICSSRSCFTP